ncbi:LysM peptidoglycan-binding domain-containing protein [Lactobacillus sp. S2-2]|nr:LysM peptidoglycan-binding domain-containing protein [Lactobacillus sp. S2-2]
MKSVITLGTAALGLFLVSANAEASTNQVTVKSGDTVAKIANANNVSIDSIKNANNLKDINVIYVGEQLNLTSEASQAQPSQNVQSQNTQQTNQVQSNQTQTNYSSNVSGSDSSAKAWIANRESGGSYSARNGQYAGKYQLSSSYLNGDYSAANQEKVADNYVNSRYGSWSAAKSFWQANGWY